MSTEHILLAVKHNAFSLLKSWEIFNSKHSDSCTKKAERSKYGHWEQRLFSWSLHNATDALSLLTRFPFFLLILAAPVDKAI